MRFRSSLKGFPQNVPVMRTTPSSVTSAYSTDAPPALNAAPSLDTASIAAAQNSITSRLRSAVDAEVSRMSADLTVNSNVQSASRSGHAVSGDAAGGAGTVQPIIVRPNWKIVCEGELAQVGRVLNPVIKADEIRVGRGVT